MPTTHKTFSPSSDQRNQIAALSAYAWARGCIAKVHPCLNRPIGTKTVIVSGPRSQLWKVMVFPSVRINF